jgi:hypothetical protein
VLVLRIGCELRCRGELLIVDRMRGGASCHCGGTEDEGRKSVRRFGHGYSVAGRAVGLKIDLLCTQLYTYNTSMSTVEYIDLILEIGERENLGIWR